MNARSIHQNLDIFMVYSHFRLHHAAAAGNHAAMEVLLARGANIGLRDSVGASTLHYAVTALWRPI